MFIVTAQTECEVILNPAKIHILGGPGSGKTTLAREIAALLNVPHHDLDDVTQKNGSQAAAYLADVATILAQPGWVTGGYGDPPYPPFLLLHGFLLWMICHWLPSANGTTGNVASPNTAHGRKPAACNIASHSR